MVTMLSGSGAGGFLGSEGEGVASAFEDGGAGGTAVAEGMELVDCRTSGGGGGGGGGVKGG